MSEYKIVVDQTLTILFLIRPKSERIQTHLHKETMSERENEGSWGSRFLEGASVLAELLSSSSSANPQLQSPFAAGLGYKEDDQEKAWKRPEIGWVKLNVDGSREHEGPSAGCGGVLRNESGEWLLGFAQKLDSSYKVQDTELQAILVGMQLARENWESMKAENLIVESDNEDVVKMVVNEPKENHRWYRVVQCIRNLAPNRNVKFVYIDRGANGVANRLARKACSLYPTHLQKYPLPPDNDIKTLYEKDLGIEAKSERSETHLHKATMSGRENEGSESSWGSMFLKGASVVAAAAVVAGGLYALLSDDDGAKSQEKVWKKPEVGWVKLNVDGSRDHERPSAGCGGVLRNESGEWVRGFALKLNPIYEADDTELHAILEGMQFVRETMRVENLIVESDNGYVVEMVKGQREPKKNHRVRVYDVVQRIRKLVNDDPKWNVELVPIHRDANGVANGLARKARFLSSTALQDYPSPPDNDIKTLYKKDLGIE